MPGAVADSRANVQDVLGCRLPISAVYDTSAGFAGGNISSLLLPPIEQLKHGMWFASHRNAVVNFESLLLFAEALLYGTTSRVFEVIISYKYNSRLPVYTTPDGSGPF